MKTQKELREEFNNIISQVEERSNEPHITIEIQESEVQRLWEILNELKFATPLEETIKKYSEKRCRLKFEKIGYNCNEVSLLLGTKLQSVTLPDDHMTAGKLESYIERMYESLIGK